MLESKSVLERERDNNGSERTIHHLGKSSTRGRRKEADAGERHSTRGRDKTD